MMATLQIVLLFGMVALSYSDLTDLYNSQVRYAEYYKRPLSGSSSGSSRKRSLGWYYHVYHTGVVVTTTDGSRWLIHKGDGYGENWDTVITNAGYMSSRWTRMKCGTVSGHTVNDFMQAGRIDCDYNVWTCNCQHASKGMWRLVTEVRC